MTSQRDESSITGTVLMSGSEAMRLRNRVIAATESSIASSMFTSMSWAPAVHLLAGDLDGLVVAVLEDRAWRTCASR